MAKTYTSEQIGTALDFANTKWKTAVAELTQANTAIATLTTENTSLKKRVADLEGKLAEYYVEVTDPNISSALDTLLNAAALTKGGGTGVNKSVLPLDNQFMLLAEGVDKKKFLTLEELNALVQFPKRVIEPIVKKGFLLPNGVAYKFPQKITYADAINFVQTIKPASSSIKKVNPFIFLSQMHVKKILGITTKELNDLMASGMLVGIKLDSINSVFFWGDVIHYIKSTSADYKYMVIPHVFYFKVYRAVLNDSTFSKLENDVIFGFSEFGKDWVQAHSLLAAFDPSIGAYMDSHPDMTHKGNLKVRSWITKYRPELLEEMLSLGDDGYIKYITKYTTYDKTGELTYKA